MSAPSALPAHDEVTDATTTRSLHRRRLTVFLRNFSRSPAGMSGAVVLLFLLVLVVFGSFIAPYDPLAQNARPLLGPGSAHWFGTDDLGRDILSRVIFGTRAALTVAFGSAALSCLIGIPLGLAAGYLGRWVDALSMRFVDVILSMPGIVVALLIVAILGPGTLNLILAIAIGTAPSFARLARASTLAVREQEYVKAARAMGAGSPDVMLRTVLPNILSPIIVQFVVTASIAVVAGASLSFLGLGEPPPAPSWGEMLYSARSYLYQSPWYGVLPGLALVITIAAFDGIGRGLRQALDTGGADRAGAEAIL